MNNHLKGEIVTWDQNGLVDLQKAQDAADANGLPMKFEITPMQAFKRAADNLAEERVIDKIKIDGDDIVYQFTSKAKDADKVDYTYECNLVLDKTTGKILAAGHQDIEDAMNAEYAKTSKLLNSLDITSNLKKMYKDKTDLFAINPRKGVAYFVPIEKRDFNQDVENFMNAIGGKLIRFPVPRGDEVAERNVRDAIESGLTELIQGLEEAVAGWEDTIHTKSVNVAVDNWAVASMKVDAYAQYLGERHEALTKRLEDARTDMRNKVAEAGKEYPYDRE